MKVHYYDNVDILGHMYGACGQYIGKMQDSHTLVEIVTNPDNTNCKTCKRTEVYKRAKKKD